MTKKIFGTLKDKTKKFIIKKAAQVLVRRANKINPDEPLDQETAELIMNAIIDKIGLWFVAGVVSKYKDATDPDIEVEEKVTYVNLKELLSKF